MDFEPGSDGRLVVALAFLVALAALAWFTIEPGKPRSLTLVLLAFFAVRVVLGKLRSR